jgi:hypothetical protein
MPIGMNNSPSDKEPSAAVEESMEVEDADV